MNQNTVALSDTTKDGLDALCQRLGIDQSTLLGSLVEAALDCAQKSGGRLQFPLELVGPEAPTLLERIRQRAQGRAGQSDHAAQSDASLLARIRSVAAS